MEKQEILNEYEAAMFAANESGYAGMTAEQVIRSLIERAEAAEEWVKTAERTMDYQAGVITELGIRAEAAEAKLAELEKQQAVGTARMELTIGKEGLRYYQCFVDMRPDLVVAELNTGMELFTCPAPVVNLAELVEDESTLNAGVNALVDCLEDCGDAEQGLRLALRAILRNIEEKSK